MKQTVNNGAYDGKPRALAENKPMGEPSAGGKVDHTKEAMRHKLMAAKHQAMCDHHTACAKMDALETGAKPVSGEWGGMDMAVPGTTKGK